MLAPVLTFAPALAAWAVVPFSPEVVLADINAGLLYILAMTSMGVYGVIIAGWASNSKYAFLARCGPPAVWFNKPAMGFALVCVLTVLSPAWMLGDIVKGQQGGSLHTTGT